MRTDRTIIFVPHRSGSMNVYRICSELAQVVGARLFSPNNDSDPIPLRRFCENSMKELEQPGVYGPIRCYVDIPRIEKARIAIQLRDPRDVLVSMFFSYCYSHGGEIPGDTGYRREVAQRGIDEFVLNLATAEAYPYRGDYGTGGHVWNYAGNIRKRFEKLLAVLEDYPNLAVGLSYANMVTNFDAWLHSLAGQFGISDPQLLDAVKQKFGNVSDKSEDKFAHRRQMKPGDHRDKLRPLTIQQLNDVFGNYFARAQRVFQTGATSPTE
jgi:hypothetical protein